MKKKDGSETAHAMMTCNLTHNTKYAVRSLIQRFPVTNKERTELLPKTERGNVFAVEAGMYFLGSFVFILLFDNCSSILNLFLKTKMKKDFPI